MPHPFREAADGVDEQACTDLVVPAPARPVVAPNGLKRKCLREIATTPAGSRNDKIENGSKSLENVMYISIGADFSVRDRAVIGIFDLDNTSVSKHTRAFLSEAEAQGEVVDVSGKLPKSYVLTEEFGLRRVYLTQYNATIMEKRAEAPSGIVDGG